MEKFYSLIRTKLGIENPSQNPNYDSHQNLDYDLVSKEELKEEIKEDVLSELKEKVKEDFVVLTLQLKEFFNQTIQKILIEKEKENLEFREVDRKIWEMYRTLEILEEKLDNLNDF